MKLCRCSDGERVFWGILKEGKIVPLKQPPRCGEAFVPEDREVALEAVRLLPPCEPTKAVCVGVNYLKHAHELNEAVKPEPVLFLKPVSALIGPEDVIRCPGMSREVHYEGELAVVIGKTCRQVKPEEAPACILGYTCANDVTARDLQRADGQWTRAKSFDTFLPVGPFLETDPVPDEGVLLETRVNGALVQQGNTRDMRHSPAELVAFISQIMTLLPGDVILTGTPEGVGPLAAGDEVTVRIAGIGTLRNFVE